MSAVITTSIGNYKCETNCETTSSCFVSLREIIISLSASAMRCLENADHGSADHGLQCESHPRYKLHSTVISLVLSSLGGQKLVQQICLSSTSHRSSVGQKLGRGTGIVSCPDPLARFGGGLWTRLGMARHDKLTSFPDPDCLV